MVKLGGITLRAILVVAGVLLVVMAAKVFSRLHWEPGVAALAGNWVPPDLGVFLAAGDDVLHGRNPYVDASTVGSDFGYVYPPLLAWIISPLALVAGTTAATAWTLAMLACVVGTLWVLDVHDWRCYVVALVLPFTRAALEYGTIGPLLALLVAGTWRLRDRPAAAALTTGTALALKLFLWPLGLWFLVTGRARTAALTAVSALLLVLIPWAAIGFDGLAQYPDLLHKVADRQDYRTYSLTALTRALGGSPDLARAVALVLGAALIASAIRIARKAASATGDRRSFLLLLAASLVLTPILWSHYLVLLLVAVALASPRFSALWLFLLATTVLDAFTWYRASPDGDVAPLVAVAAIVACVFTVAVRSTASAPRGAS